MWGYWCLRCLKCLQATLDSEGWCPDTWIRVWRHIVYTRFWRAVFSFAFRKTCRFSVAFRKRLPLRLRDNCQWTRIWCKTLDFFVSRNSDNCPCWRDKKLDFQLTFLHEYQNSTIYHTHHLSKNEIHAHEFGLPLRSINDLYTSSIQKYLWPYLLSFSGNVGLGEADALAYQVLWIMNQHIRCA